MITDEFKWMDVHESLPNDGETVKILHFDSTTDASKFCNGVFYVYDVCGEKPITHWAYYND